ncbi:hypothetical protein A0H81_06796 [Grifola frondosa]|uniref:Uncharacterized protein n=1 Tax=Grifola frondosa TaxID=5627 RepID=A0A1C7M8T3_GRIFR|nr:hypothetical protein A0H81_06796 [Grifola frondosa]
MTRERMCSRRDRGRARSYVQLRLPEQVTDEHSLLAELQTKFEEILIRHGLLQAGTDEQSSHPDVREMVDFYVKIVLPAGVTEPDSPLSELQSQFEQVLINHRLLKEGIVAAADEVGMSVREDPSHAAHCIRDATALHTSSLSQTTHAITSSSTAGTKTFATTAHRISGAVGAAAASAGAWMAGTLVPTNPDATQSLVSAEQAYDSVTDGVREGTTDRRDAPGCVWAGGG